MVRRERADLQRLSSRTSGHDETLQLSGWREMKWFTVQLIEVDGEEEESEKEEGID